MLVLRPCAPPSVLPDMGAKGRRTILIYVAHAPPSPRPVLTVWPLQSPGKTGGRRLAHLSNLRATLRPSVRRFLFPPVPLLPKRSSVSGLCASFRHAGVIVPPGEPPGRTSPAAMPRQHQGGGAGPSPRNHRHDRCSRWEELTGIMKDGRKAWRKTGEENTERQLDQRVTKTACAILSTFSPAFPPLPAFANEVRAFPPSSFSGGTGAQRTAETGNPCRSVAATHWRCRRQPRFCTLNALPSCLRHGFQGLRDAANATASPWNDEDREADAYPERRSVNAPRFAQAASARRGNFQLGRGKWQV